MGSERLRDWTRPHSKRTRVATWAAVRSPMSLPGQDCGGGWRNPPGDGRAAMSLLLSSQAHPYPPVLCLPFSFHSPNLAPPKAGGAMETMRSVVSHGGASPGSTSVLRSRVGSVSPGGSPRVSPQARGRGRINVPWGILIHSFTQQQLAG